MPEYLLETVGDDQHEFFRTLHSRTLNTLNLSYLLPVDHDEVQRSDIHHRLLQFVFSGRNYVGPVKQALQFGEQRRGTSFHSSALLDLGTGSGSWAIDIADEFPRAEVIAVDLAPIQPRYVALPNNSPFELCDLDQWNIPYPDSHFDFIHARSIHVGIHNYPRFLHEIARLLRPGGLVLLVEPTLDPCPPPPSVPPMSGWSAFWETYRACLRRQLIDVTVPERLANLFAATAAFENIVVKDGNIPVGFWPQDPHLLTVGQLQWMDYELFLPALRPLFLSNGLAPSIVERLVRDAQHDLYHPSYAPSTLIHIAYASKCF
ncbi:S-adenosyl-L-methionine-dependent methyltransferase [Gymnopilus junonius]|uniref:S-adenosyl-L-methionine-dependent methyltransferase n=1 Tax=Gymnopilus junonius TaxID=109634 RepID=A0A9P5NYK0_GYMJU|nr:S-adenosyl-L-methionine-dependent methyltransferase [Gymnopilus junonius]